MIRLIRLIYWGWYLSPMIEKMRLKQVLEAFKEISNLSDGALKAILVILKDLKRSLTM